MVRVRLIRLPLMCLLVRRIGNQHQLFPQLESGQVAGAVRKRQPVDSGPKHGSGGG
jgi:hypothetical protein